jgi:hypothetical protein
LNPDLDCPFGNFSLDDTTILQNYDPYILGVDNTIILPLVAAIVNNAAL